MENTFLIEIRLARTRWKIKETSLEIARRFDVLHFMERHPHITIYGPFTLNESIPVKTLLDTVGTIARQYDTIPFFISEWEKRDGMHGSVIACSVTPSESLQKLTREISSALQPLSASTNTWDQDPDKKWYHVTNANLLPSRKADAIIAGLKESDEKIPVPQKSFFDMHGRIRSFLKRISSSHDKSPLRPLLLDDAGLRITVMNNDQILGEFDLLQKRWLTEKEIHDEGAWQQTMAAFRKHAGFERIDPLPAAFDEIFVIADLHLGHANIIRYCSRPFAYPDSQEMDHVLVKNWNYTISSGNRVYYLGDLRYGEDALPAEDYRKKLKGDIVFLSGNHDDPAGGAIPSATIEYEGIQFLLIHDPALAPQEYNGWIIHGHHHNNDLRAFPFMDFAKKHINVSVEVVGYVPVSLGELAGIIKSRESSGNTEPVLLRDPCQP